MDTSRILTDADTNKLAAVKAVHLKGIICLVHKIHLMMKDALGLRSAVRAT